MRNPRPVLPVNTTDELQTGLLNKTKMKQDEMDDNLATGEREGAGDELSKKAMNLALRVKMGMVR